MYPGMPHVKKLKKTKKPTTTKKATNPSKRKHDSPPSSKKTRKTDVEVMDVTVGIQGGTPTLDHLSSIPLVPSSDPSPKDPPSKMPEGLQSITKQDIQISPPKESSKKPLHSLLMETGSVDDIIPKEKNTWPTIATRLRKVFLGHQQELPTKEDRARYVANLGTVYYQHGKKRVIRQSGEEEQENIKYLNEGQTGYMPEIANFLENLMEANGQWDYINGQDWYTKGEYVIGIDMNYYPDRSEFNPESPKFHKDTGGNNIFVNLIFDNEDQIEKTEWFTDVDQPSKARAKWQQDLLPKSHLKELELSRAALQKEDDKTSVSGGATTAGEKNTYVSWVDDLVWHSSPTENQRIEYNSKVAASSYDSLKRNFKYTDKAHKLDVSAVEILGTMAESPETQLYKWLEKADLGAQDITYEVAEKAWYALYDDKVGGKAKFLQDAAERSKSPWRVTGSTSEANAQDTRLKGSKSIDETPVGLSKRRRANSLNPEAIQQVRKTNEGKPRSFLRTWVRILPKDSSELTGITW